LNFFVSSDTDPNSPDRESNFFRALEFVRVPSRFDGADHIFNPKVFEASTPPRLLAPHTFYSPFNRLTAYRDAGLININTVFDDGTTWGAVMNNDTPARIVDHWRKIFASRQGYGNVIAAPNPLLPVLNNNSPTFFANPFRPYSDSYNVPIVALAAQNANPNGPPRRQVEATLLRPDTEPDPNGGVPFRPLLAPQTNADNAVLGGSPPQNRGVGAGDARAAFNDGDRNPYFRYQSLTKVGNILTTRSNVYGIWITVGYFEVTHVPQLPRATHPDGYVLGQELGADTGEIVRHRMFCVLDRTIPVAFQRGEDYNVQKAVVLKKIIE
jgi:hypothetical protein